jgi:cold shock protein
MTCRSGLVIGRIERYIAFLDFGQTIGPFHLKRCCWVTFNSLPNFEYRVAAALRAAKTYLYDTTKGYRMTSGTVKFYNDQKGYGFIAPDEGGNDVFVHATALERAGIRRLAEGQKVQFETQRDSRSGKIAVSTLQVL